MHLLIPLDEACGALDPLTNPYFPTGRPDEHLGRAADFMTALVKSGTCKFYEIEQDRWVLEVRVPEMSYAQPWTH